MKRKSEVLAAIKLFAKEVGGPDAIVSDMAKEQVSQDVRNFCNTIGTTVRALEEGTPWSNKAELYIKLMKQAVRKDMKESNCPLRFWDYNLNDKCGFIISHPVTTSKFVEATPIRKSLENKATSPIYAMLES